MNIPLLGVNIDHIATLRNARGAPYPCPIEGALICQKAGADGITLHLREDRRHIKDQDVYAIKEAVDLPINLEMAVTDEMLAIALDVCPDWVCLVPEKRAELTTEGGLDVAALADSLRLGEFIQKLHKKNIKVSLFIDPDVRQIDKAIDLNADAIELHTGAYAQASLVEDKAQLEKEFIRIKHAVKYTQDKNTQNKNHILINAGHGLTQDNVAAIAQINGIHELNIGHAIIADAVFMGLAQAVLAMKSAFTTKTAI